MVVAAVLLMFLFVRSMREHTNNDSSDALLNQRLAARFGAFEALDAAMRKYSSSHGGQIPSSIDMVVKASPELFTPDVIQQDQQVNHNLSQTILLTNVDFAPGSEKACQYKWVIALYVPAVTMPMGFPRTSDFVRWSGDTPTPGKWTGGFIAARDASEYFGEAVVDAARRQVVGASSTAPGAATQP